jgi:hypothetical protein
MSLARRVVTREKERERGKIEREGGVIDKE